MPSPQSWSRVTQSSFSASSDVNALLSGAHWANSKIAYSFPEANSTWSTSHFLGYGPSFSNAEPWHTDYQPLLESDREHFKNALQKWANVANIDFTEIKETAHNVGDIRAAYTGNDHSINAQAWAYLPANSASAGDIWFNNNGSSSSEYWEPGSYEFMTVMHELGHALGLKHPFEASNDNATILPADVDGRSYTIMSYSAKAGFRDTFFSLEPTTLMMLDIAAIQHLYGANMAHNAGDTVYQFSDEEPYHQTIWDGGGIDTIHYTGSREAIIDLQQEHGSKIGQTIYISPTFRQAREPVENIWIARNADIENATGGQNNDQLIGNALNNILQGHAGDDNITGDAGNDSITGGAGNDSINGGAGVDTAYYSLTHQNYTITSNAGGHLIQANSGEEGVDTIREVERIAFTDTKLALDFDGHAGEVSKIIGVIFGAQTLTDKQLIGIGLQRLDEGTSYAALMQQALESRLGTGFTDQAEIQLLYQNILGTQPSQDELNYWTNSLNTSQYTQTSLAVMAADLDLNAQNIDLVGLSQTGLAFI